MIKIMEELTAECEKLGAINDRGGAAEDVQHDVRQPVEPTATAVRETVEQAQVDSCNCTRKCKTKACSCFKNKRKCGDSCHKRNQKELCENK